MACPAISSKTCRKLSPPFGAFLNSTAAEVRETFERRFDIARVAREYVQVYRTLASAEEAHRREPRRNGFTQNHVPRPQSGDPPILLQLGTEVANVTPAE